MRTQSMYSPVIIKSRAHAASSTPLMIVTHSGHVRSHGHLMTSAGLETAYLHHSSVGPGDVMTQSAGLDLGVRGFRQRFAGVNS